MRVLGLVVFLAHGVTDLVPASVTTQASGPNWELGLVDAHSTVLSPPG